MENANRIWEQIKNTIKEQKLLQDTSYDQCIAPITEIYKVTETNFYLIVENTLIKFRLEKFFSQLINDLWYKCSGEKKKNKQALSDDPQNHMLRISNRVQLFLGVSSIFKGET